MNRKTDDAAHTRGIASLRTISFRLSSTPKKQLPVVVPQILYLLESCQSILSVPDDLKPEKGPLPVIRHKYETQLSSLLIAKTEEERWSAVILIKSTVELSQLNNSRKIGIWIRGLLEILRKSNPATTKRLCIITLTRIFLLSQKSATLVRELTTPSLPLFITACMKNVESSDFLPGRPYTRNLDGVREAVLQSFCYLLPHHTTIFRPFASRIRNLVSSILALTPSSFDANESLSSLSRTSLSCVNSSRTLLVLLNSCVPKPQIAQQWTGFLNNVLHESHRVVSDVFLAGGEALGAAAKFPRKTESKPSPEISSATLDFAPWSGINGGCERLVALLKILEECFLRWTSNSVFVPIGEIFELLHRTMSVVVPLNNLVISSNHETEHQNPTSKEDRDQFWCQLPHIHATALEVMVTVFKRLQGCCKAFILPTLDHLEWLFKHEMFRSCIRLAAYKLTSILVNDSGPVFTKKIVKQLTDIMHSCCNDLETALITPWKGQDASIQSQSEGDEKIIVVDKLVDDTGNKQPLLMVPEDLVIEAYDLLPILLTNLRSEFVPKSIRSKIDQIAVFTQHRAGMWASVLNPCQNQQSEKTTSSLLPLMARAYPNSQELDAILRPRMPIVSGVGSIQEINQAADLVDDNMSDARSVSPSSSDLRTSSPQFLDESNLPAPMNHLKQSQIWITSQAAEGSSDVTMDVRPIEEPNKSWIKREAPFDDITDVHPKRTRIDSTERPSTTTASSAYAKSVPEGGCAQPSTAQVPNEFHGRHDIEYEGSDDDDFEIPPLTMEQDTEEEDA